MVYSFLVWLDSFQIGQTFKFLTPQWTYLGKTFRTDNQYVIITYKPVKIIKTKRNTWHLVYILACLYNIFSFL